MTEQEEAPGALDEDWQEALSLAYAVQTRVAILASGRWAVWIAGQPPIIQDNFEPDQMARLIRGAQVAAQLQREAFRVPSIAALSLEEMEL